MLSDGGSSVIRTRPDGMSLMVILLVLACRLAVAAEVPNLEIARLVVDGRDLAPDQWQQAIDHPEQPLELAICQHITVLFRQLASSEASAYRLCHRLDGVDADWREEAGGMIVRLEFWDKEKPNPIMPVETMEGESPGWDGDVRSSPLVSHGFQAVVPAGALFCDLWFTTNPPKVLGMGAITDMRIDIRSANSATQRSVRPEMGDSAQRLHTGKDEPQCWQRRANKQMAQLTTRRDGSPTLALVDERVDDYGAWRLNDQGRFAVAPGETVRVEWQACHSFGVGEIREVNYAGLEVGWHQLRLGQRSLDGKRIVGELLLPIRILPPPWRRPTTWITTVAGLVAAIALITSLLFRHRSLQRVAAAERKVAVEHERLRIARDIHDDLGSSLAQIAMIGNLARGKPTGGRDHVGDMVARAEESVRRLRAIVWAVDPAYDALEHLAVRLTSVAEEHVRLAGLVFRAEIPEPLPDLDLSAAIRHHFVLAVREAVNNAVRHAHPTTITVRLALKPGILLVEVVDDGRGCDPQVALAAGRGIARLHQRMTGIGGRCGMTSSSGGTTMTFSIPLSDGVA